MLVGDSVPLRGVIEAVGQAAGVLIGQEQPAGVVIPSTAVINGDNNTVLIVGADDSVVAGAVEKKVLYGAYHNYVSTTGVSALWNAVITDATTSQDQGVVVQGKTLTITDPQNLVHPTKQFIFYTKDAASGPLSEEEAVKRFVFL